MESGALQAALNANDPALKLVVDGIAGRKTMAAIDLLLSPVVDRIILNRWADSRRLIAAEQFIYQKAGIEVGKIDGLVGEQTRYARTVWEARQKGSAAAAAIEAWRDKEPELVPAKVTAAHLKWPRQKDVEKFFGQPGENQAIFETPFPMRLAWEPSQIVSRFSCHMKVREHMRRIWTRTLEHYGHERIIQLRLDMFGGCLNVRKMRGGSAWSMHAWGIAMDVDPDRNQLLWGRDKASLDDPAYEPFWKFVYDEGFLSLGRERNRDWMHLQATRDFS